MIMAKVEVNGESGGCDGVVEEKSGEVVEWSRKK